MANAPVLPSAIVAVMEVFKKYASKEGDKDKLSKSEMKELIQVEMAPMIMESKNPDQVDKLFKCMDVNGDDQVDFTEFMMALAVFACICHNIECDKSKCMK